MVDIRRSDQAKKKNKNKNSSVCFQPPVYKEINTFSVVRLHCYKCHISHRDMHVNTKK